MLSEKRSLDQSCAIVERRGFLRVESALLVVVLVLANILASGPVSAQGISCPAKVVRYVVPYPPGSPIDIAVRKIVQATTGPLGTTIIVENKPGASGSIGAAEVAKSAPDGCTVLATINDPVVSNTVLIESPGYDVQKDFAFVTKLTFANAGVVANSKVKANTLAELVGEAKASPIPLKYGSYGPGSFPQLIFESFARQAGIKLDHVPYRGPPQLVQAMVGGEVELGTGGGNLITQLNDGSLKPLAQVGARRAWVRDVPTFTEAGFDDLILRTPIWVGLLVPAKTPKATIEKLVAANRIALANPETLEFLKNIAFVPVGSSPEEFEAEWREEFAVVPPLIRALGIKAQ
jgi:tripartite-type tricarboxylate transporter receptor subunit TctC